MTSFPSFLRISPSGPEISSYPFEVITPGAEDRINGSFPGFEASLTLLTVGEGAEENNK